MATNVLVTEAFDCCRNGRKQILPVGLLCVLRGGEGIIGNITGHQHAVKLLQKLHQTIHLALFGATLCPVDLMHKGIHRQAQGPEDPGVQKAVVAKHKPADVPHMRSVSRVHLLAPAEVVDRHLQRPELGIQKLGQVLQLAPFQHGVL